MTSFWNMLQQENKGSNMKFYDLGVTILIVVLLVGVIGMASVKYLGPDNVVEEVAEKVIEVETGKDIDLTPKSEEK